MPATVRPVADERDALLAFLDQQRYVLRIAADGLTDDQARSAPTVSSLTVGGLIKHCGAVERTWMDTVLERRSGPLEDYAANFVMGPDETLTDILAGYDAAVANTAAVIGAVADLDQSVPAPKGVPWFEGIDAWSVRWVLLHLIQETARHAGHADIVREAVDGATAFPLMAAVEGWPDP